VKNGRRKVPSLFRVFVSVLLLVLLASTASAQTALSIINPGFESDILAAGAATTDVFAAGWTCAAVPSGGCGAFHPQAAQFGSVPEGVNVAYSNGGTISQVLAATLSSNTLYTLTVKVGKRLDLNFPGYVIQLMAGNTVLAQDNSTVSPASGAFLSSTITYQSPVSGPLLGQNLKIVLLANGIQGIFDAVSLSTSQATGCGTVPSKEYIRLGNRIVAVENPCTP